MPPRSRRSWERSGPPSCFSVVVAVSDLGLALLGAASAPRPVVVGDDDVELLLTSRPHRSSPPGSRPRSSSPRRSPASRRRRRSRCSPSTPFRIPVGLGDEDAFLLLPLYLVLTASVIALAYRVLRGTVRRSSPPPPAAPLPPSWSSLGVVPLDHDERQGRIVLAFFVFPFVAEFGVVARSPLAVWVRGHSRSRSSRSARSSRPSGSGRRTPTHGLLRPRPRGRERVRPGSRSPRSSRIPACTAATSSCRSRCCSSSSGSAGDAAGLGRHRGGHRLPLPGSLLLVLAVELRGALRRDLRDRARRRWPAAANRADRMRGCRHARRGRIRRPVGRREVRDGDHERPLAACRDHAGRLPRRSGCRRGHRRAGAGERGEAAVGMRVGARRTRRR